MYYKKLVGNKIYLSPCDINNEVKDMTRWVNEDEDIAIYNGFYDSLLNEDKMHEKLNMWASGPYLFSIVDNNDNFVGHITLFNMDHNKLFATMGIYIGKEYRNLGYGKEAIELLINYAFNYIGLHSIHLEVFSYNKKAIEVYTKMGFNICGIYHNARYHSGKLHNIIMMELLRK